MKFYIFILIILLSIRCEGSFFQQNPKDIYDSIYVYNPIRPNLEAEQDSIGQILLDYSKKRLEDAKKRKASWKNIKFKYAKAFLYNYIGFEIVYDGKNLIPGILAEKKLSDFQSKIAFELVTKPKIDNEDENWVAKCFEPHHALVFYNAENEIVAYCSICFMCNQTQVYPLDGYDGISRYKTFFKNLGFPILANEGELEEYIQFLQKSLTKKR